MFVVGTAYIKEGENEPTRGRLLLLQLTGTPGGPQELQALFEQTVNGSVYSLAAMSACPGKFVATVNSQVSVFEIDAAAPRTLKLVCKTAGMILALYADVSGHTVVVGDLMRSIAVYSFNPEKQELTLVAKDFDSAPHPACVWWCCVPCMGYIWAGIASEGVHRCSASIASPLSVLHRTDPRVRAVSLPRKQK